MKLRRLVPIALFAMTDTCPAESVSPTAQNAVTIRDTIEYRNFSEIEVCILSKLIAARLDRASIAQNHKYHKWHIIEWPSGNVRLTAEAGETINTLGWGESSYPHWSPDCRWLYYRALHDGEVQIWRLNAASGEQEKITSDGANVLDFALIQNGNSLVYMTNASRAAILSAEAREYRNGVLINETLLPTGALIKTQPLLGRWSTWRAWSLEDSSLVYGHLLSQEPVTYKTITIQNHKIRTATEPEIAELAKPHADWAPQLHSGFMKSPTSNWAAVVLKKKKTPYGSVLLSSLATKQSDDPADLHECEDDRCTAKHLVPLTWSADGKSIFFIGEQTRGAAGIYKWTPVSGEVRTLYESSGLLGALEEDGTGRGTKSGACPVIEDFAICTAADSKNPPHLLAISLSSGFGRTVMDPNAELRMKFALNTERITWKDKLGREIIGVLVYPRDFETGSRYPLVITTYMCRGFLHGGIADGAPEYVLAENGFLVLCIDRNPEVEAFRKSHSRAEARYMGYLTEFESAIDTLAKKGLANRDRVGVTGLSSSSQGISYALTRSNIFSVAALRSIGVIEPAIEMRLRPGMPTAEFIFRDHGLTSNEQDKKAVYENLSVTLRADRLTAPVLVQASDTEYSWSLPGFAALQKLGKPVEMFVFPEETHILFQPIHRYVNFTRNLDWFQFWLQGYEDPAPEKQEQYTRWRSMRDEQCSRRSKNSRSWYC